MILLNEIISKKFSSDMYHSLKLHGRIAFVVRAHRWHRKWDIQSHSHLNPGFVYNGKRELCRALESSRIDVHRHGVYHGQPSYAPQPLMPKISNKSVYLALAPTSLFASRSAPRTIYPRDLMGISRACSKWANLAHHSRRRVSRRRIQVFNLPLKGMSYNLARSQLTFGWIEFKFKFF